MRNFSMKKFGTPICAGPGRRSRSSGWRSSARRRRCGAAAGAGRVVDVGAGSLLLRALALLALLGGLLRSASSGDAGGGLSPPWSVIATSLLGGLRRARRRPRRSPSAGFSARRGGRRRGGGRLGGGAARRRGGRRPARRAAGGGLGGLARAAGWLGARAAGSRPARGRSAAGGVAACPAPVAGVVERRGRGAWWSVALGLRRQRPAGRDGRAGCWAPSGALAGRRRGGAVLRGGLQDAGAEADREHAGAAEGGGQASTARRLAGRSGLDAEGAHSSAFFGRTFVYLTYAAPFWPPGDCDLEALGEQRGASGSPGRPRSAGGRW